MDSKIISNIICFILFYAGLMFVSAWFINSIAQIPTCFSEEQKVFIESACGNNTAFVQNMHQGICGWNVNASADYNLEPGFVKCCKTVYVDHYKTSQCTIRKVQA